MPLHPVHDSETIAQCVKVAGLDVLSAELARRAKVYASMCQDLVVFARHEEDPKRVEMYASQCRIVAAHADKCYQACDGLEKAHHVAEAQMAKVAAEAAYSAILAMTAPVRVAK